MKSYIAELNADVDALRKSNLPGLGRSADRLAAAIADLEGATTFLHEALAEGRNSEALAGATPYLRLFSLAAGGAYLARAAVAANGGKRAALCRFYAENIVSEAAALKDRVVEGAESLAEAELA